MLAGCITFIIFCANFPHGTEILNRYQFISIYFNIYALSGCGVLFRICFVSYFIDQGRGVDVPVYKAKQKEISSKAQAIFKRYSELTERPAAVGKAQAALTEIKGKVGCACVRMCVSICLLCINSVCNAHPTRRFLVFYHATLFHYSHCFTTTCAAT